MLQFAFYFFLVLLLVFCVVMIHDARTLWSGFSCFSMLLCLAMCLLLTCLEYTEWLKVHIVQGRIVWFFMFMAVGFVIAFPGLLLLLFFVEGIKVLRHEGIKPTNFLSLLFSVLVLVYLRVWPMIGNLKKNTVSTIIYAVIGFSAIYLLYLMAMYCLSAILNLIHLKKKRKLDYIVVLGSGLRGTKGTPLLAGRIERGIELWNCNPGATLIMSGGQGRGEELPEGEAMAAYAIDRGVDAERIIVERKSVSTEENLRFSGELMRGEKPKIAVVTTSYHVFRALLLARKQGMKCVGFGSKTKWYFTLNAIIREFIGYLRLTWKKHALVIGAVACMIIAIHVERNL